MFIKIGDSVYKYTNLPLGLKLSKVLIEYFLLYKVEYYEPDRKYSELYRSRTMKNIVFVDEIKTIMKVDE